MTMEAGFSRPSLHVVRDRRLGLARARQTTGIVQQALEKDGMRVIPANEESMSEANAPGGPVSGDVSGASRHPFKVTGMDLSGYMVEDAVRAIAFYRDVLGLEPVLLYPENRGAEYELSDDTTFGLWGGGGKVMPFQPSNGILFAVDDLDAAVGAVKARGIAVIMENETAACRMAMIHDSEGNIVTLHKRKR